MSPTPPTSRPPARLTDLLDARFMARLDQLDVASRKILRGRLRGERQSKQRGTGVEFADHRQYALGDDVRFVDWNIFGRLDQLFLKLFVEEQDLSLHILVDASASTTMGDPPKSRQARRLAAALAYLGLVNNNRVHLCMFADGVTGRLPNLRGRQCLAQMAEFLLTSPADGPSDFDKAARQWTANRAGAGVTVVLSDFFFKQGYESGLRRLISDNYDLCVIQLLSPQERQPDIAGDLRLVDIEDADVAEVTVGRTLLKHYERVLAAYCTMLKEFCIRHGATYVLTDSAQPVDRLVLEQLRRLRIVK
jgi:uncharacterized protein (DUF58 family)